MPSPSIQDLLAQRAELDKQIAEAQRSARADAIAKIKVLMAEYGLTAADLTGRAPAAPKAEGAKKVAAKYRDPATGQTWTGRGLKPKWLTAALSGGKSLDDFAI
jgi:DNA-binding protein H-NS